VVGTNQNIYSSHRGT